MPCYLDKRVLLGALSVWLLILTTSSVRSFSMRAPEVNAELPAATEEEEVFCAETEMQRHADLRARVESALQRVESRYEDSAGEEGGQL